MAQFAPIQTSPTMVWTKYPNFQVPPEPPLATNRPRAAPKVSVPGCSGVPSLAKMPAVELVKSIRSIRRSPMGATGVQISAPTMTMTQAVAQVTGGIVHLVLNGVLGYYVGKWSGASKGWTAVGTAVLGPLGTFASVGLTGGRKKCATPNCSCKPNRRKRRVRSASQQWDQLWENYIAARRSGSKQRILDTAELLETFDRSKGWKPTVTVSSVRREFGWK